MVGAYHSALLKRLGVIEGIGQDATRHTQQSAQRKAQVKADAEAAQFARWQQSNSNLQPSSGGGSLNSFINAIMRKESGGNYGAVNRHSGALGAYQVMPGNVGAWSRSALGRSISQQEFLRNPQLQDQIARHRLSQYYNSYGPAGAAVAWYAGPRNARKYVQNPNGWNKSQGQYPTVQAYVQSILGMMR